MTSRPFPLTRRAALGVIGATLACPPSAGADGLETLGGTAFGTGWRLAAPPGSGLARLGPAIRALFAGIDATFSPWRPDSELSRFNARADGSEAASPELVAVTAAALEISRRSEGAFDPTVGPLVARWGFGPIDRGGAPDWRALGVGPAGVSSSRPDLTLDLCGIAKGRALDRAAALARSAGLADLLFELGGEFVALGRHPAGRDWRVAVEGARPGQPPPAVLRLPPGTAVATSGALRQSYALAGRVYGHVIDPRTGAPAAGPLRSVTVVAGDAMTADGWATALFAAGEAAGPGIAAREGIAALFVTEGDEGPSQVRTGAIRELIS